ncbi:MAG: type II toxin-antitoxin system VapC family toxin [Deltaproteobacteria bacterium]|nr:type II toxin-antitoxin system VapC family toxin [Deltaproteobacteria bacterium]
MMDSRIYLDTSAYLSLLFHEASSTKIMNVLRSKVICSSVLLFVEAERNIIRVSREKAISETAYEKLMVRLHEDAAYFLLKDVTLDLCLLGNYPPLRTPRSNDLIHLRTALWFRTNGGLQSFVTCDAAQQRAAIDFGLSVPF